MARHAQEVRDAPEFLEIRAAANLSRTDGNGGYFVPPAWLMTQWIELARAGRPTADLINSQALPPGTDSINIPKVSTGTAADIQTADNAAVAETAFTDTSISVPVKTIAGQQTMAIQLIDQSPLNFDEIIFRDLLADYATKTDVQVLNGSNGSGQVKGLLATSGTKTAAVSAVTGIGVYSAVANVVQQVHTSALHVAAGARHAPASVGVAPGAGRRQRSPAGPPPGQLAGQRGRPRQPPGARRDRSAT
jgi:HK97 family phage major capsid protein